jgi:hypothetical protein
MMKLSYRRSSAKGGSETGGALILWMIYFYVIDFSEFVDGYQAG